MTDCVICNATIEASRRGRPRRYCLTCSPPGGVGRRRPRPLRLVPRAPTLRAGTCVVCGVAILQVGTGRPRSVCSRRCKGERDRRTKHARRARTKACAHCGEPFAVNGGQKYCTAECREAAHTRACRVCGQRFVAKSAGQRACSDRCSRIRLPLLTCRNCGKEFRPKRGDRTTCCSQRCGWRWHSKQDAARRPAPSSPIKYGNCAQCGKTFIVRTRRKICSVQCSRLLSSQRAHTKNSAKKTVTARPCVECSGVFTPEYGDKRRRFCSEWCVRRHHKRVGKAMRRARSAGATREQIDPLMVFKASGWRCYLCGVVTPPDKRGTTAADAPELDHVIPLARGGTHTRANVACACRSCNQAKGAGGLGQSWERRNSTAGARSRTFPRES